MAHISEHDSKEEWESYLGENGWVDFFVHWNTISINDFLEWPCELIDFDIGRGFNCVISELLKVCGRVECEDLSYFGLLIIGTPEVADIGTLSHFHKIELEVEVLFLGNKPFLYFESTHRLIAISVNLVDLYQVLLQLSS